TFHLLLAFLIAPVTLLTTGCQTKRSLQREREYERLRQEVRAVRGTKADIDVVTEDLRRELTRLVNFVEEQAVYQRRATDALRDELKAMALRVEAIEGALANRAAMQQNARTAPAKSLESAKKLFDEKRYDDAIEILKELQKSNPSTTAKFLLAESEFA